LSSTFGRIKALDISKPHLDILEKEISSKQIANIDLIQLNELSVIRQLDPIDFFYSEITLQHNSPPIQREILENMLKKIKKKGYFYFQIPTYIPNYEFNLEKYLKIKNEKMEMHMLPMNQIFEIVYESNCRILNVIRDTSAGLEIESHTFIGIKHD
jgi:phospholipid N-methyltransferase